MKFSGSTSSALLLLSLALNHHVTSFSVVQPMSSDRFSAGALSTPPTQGEQAPSQALRLRTRRNMVGFEEVITPSIILLGAAAASVYANSGQLDFSELTSSFQGSSSSDDSSSTAVTAVAAPAAAESETPASEPAAVVAKKETAPAPKSTMNLALEVGSTIEEQRKTNDLVASRQAAAKTSSSTGTTVETVKEILSRTPSEDKPKSGRKRKFVLKVIKKVVAPWRKWDDIQ